MNTQNKYRLTVNHLTTSIQAVSCDYRWAFANTPMVQKLAECLSRSQRIHPQRQLFLPPWIKVTGLPFSVLYFVVVYIYLFIRSCGKRNSSPVVLCENLFIGFGSTAEKSIYTEYLNHSASYSYIRNFNDTYSFAKPIFWSFFIRSVKTYILLDPTLKLQYKVNFKTKLWYLYFFAENIAIFTMWFMFFKQLKERKSFDGEVVFVHSGLSSFAAVNAGLKTKFWSHGLIRRSNVFADFDKCVVWTVPERTYLTARLSLSEVITRSYPRCTKSPTQNRNLLLISSNQSAVEYSLFFDFVKEYGNLFEKIYLRLRPGAEIPENYNSMQPWFEFSCDSSFHDLLLSIEPMFVVSSFSASLIESLNYGVLPIMLARENDETEIDAVFPLRKHCLTLPEYGSRLESISHDRFLYERVRQCLLTGA